MEIIKYLCEFFFNDVLHFCGLMFFMAMICGIFSSIASIFKKDTTIHIGKEVDDEEKEDL